MTHRTTRSLCCQLALPFALLTLAACAAATDGAPSQPETPDLGVLQEAVKNGIGVNWDDYGGVVRLWEHNSRFGELHQFCSGVLFRNDLVLTAAHCVFRTQAQLENGWPDTSTDTSEVLVSSANGEFIAFGQGAPMPSPVGTDIAAFYLSQSIPVRSNGQIIHSGWTRSLGSVSTQTAVGVYGFGFTTPNPTSDVCAFVSSSTGNRIPGCLADPLDFTMAWDYPARLINGNMELDTVIILPGDSGGMTTELNLYEPDLADQRLVGINSNLMGCADEACGHTSRIARVDFLGEWFATM